MALEWLKGILGDAYTEDADKKISDEIGKGFVARPDFNALNETKKGLETQLKAAGETIDKFKGMDVDAIRASADAYKAAAEKAEKDACEKIASFQFETLLDGAIREGKGRNATAIKALLDVDALRASKNQAEDIKAALSQVQSANDYLFETVTAAQPYADGTGTAPIFDGGADAKEIASIRAAAGLATTAERE